MKANRTVVLVAVAAGLGLSTACQKAAAPVEPQPSPASGQPAVVIKTHQVAGHIYMLEGRGGNIGVSAGEDGVVLVDDQFAPLAPQILDAVQKLGKGDPTFVINTHFHGDHTGGNPQFGKSAHIVAHENVRKRLASQQERRGQVIEPMVKEGLPVFTFRESVSLHLNGEEIRVVHFPTGHTDGDSVVFFTGANVVHMGDHYFNGRFPYVDAASGGDVQKYAENVGAVLERVKEDTKIIPGHGALSNASELKVFHRTLVDTIGIVKRAMKAGKSLEQIKAAGLPAKYKGWGDGFISTEAWLTAIHASLSAQ